ncbi:MAG TPA: dihydrofolate reductase family protein [Solirubrobacteraceae bacterium]
MRKLVVTTFVTVDGVMQSPGAPEEDPSNGFELGGWLVPFADEDMGRQMVEWFSHAEDFLLGARTYEIFAAYWPHAPTEQDPIAKALNTLPRHVASRTLGHVDWEGTHLIEGDVAEGVAALKDRDGGELQVHGSGGLIQTLLEHDLVDELRLMIFPLVLGSGKRLFADGTVPAGLRLSSSSATGAGVLIATYDRAGEVATGSMALD